MPFLEGFNQAFFPTLLRVLQQQGERQRQEEGLNTLMSQLNPIETVQNPPLQVPAQVGNATHLSIPAMSLAQPPTQEQQHYGWGDQQATQPLLQYLTSTGQGIDLNILHQLLSAGQGQFKEIPAGTTYGIMRGSQFTPQGTTEFKPTVASQTPPFQFGSPVTTDTGELQIPVGNKKTGEAKLVPTNEKALPKPIPIPKSKAELTSATRTMLEMAPTVKYFVDKIKNEVQQNEQGLGVAASRWREFKAGKVGLADPAFTAIRTNVGLLTTALMRMHVGARGGEYIMKHFQEMISEGKQSPQNLQSALDEINSYADQLISEKGQASTGSQTTTSKFKILKKE